MASNKSKGKRYKCPYCEYRGYRTELIEHVEDKHEEMIPKDYSPARVVYNAINKKERGSCMICHKETEWDENKQRYNTLCGSKKCKDEYVKIVRSRMVKKYGTDNLLKDPDFQKKMLENRSISGKYKFEDGGVVGYVGSYEKKFLEFMDKFLHIKSYDIISPGPTIPYKYNGKEHAWITDFIYEPYNLVFDIKDGGDNPNTRDMKDYREKQTAKERAIADYGDYNYIRLTDNKFEQLITIFMELKEKADDKPIIRINESFLLEGISRKAIEDLEFKEEKSLSSFTNMGLSSSFTHIYAKTYPFLEEIPMNNRTKGCVWLDNNKDIVALINTEEKEDGTVWIERLVLFEKYRGYGLTKQILQYSVKKFGITHISVKKDDQTAYDLYRKLGFKTYKRTEETYFLRNINESSIIESKYSNSNVIPIDTRKDILALNTHLINNVPNILLLNLEHVKSQIYAIDFCGYDISKNKLDDSLFGEAVVAVNDGVVETISNSYEDNNAHDEQNPFGNFIVIKHDNYYSLYSHLKKNSINVKPGQKVHTGDNIAKIGKSGNSDIAHLHFQACSSVPSLNTKLISSEISFSNFYCQTIDENLLSSSISMSNESLLNNKLRKANLNKENLKYIDTKINLPSMAYIRVNESCILEEKNMDSLTAYHLEPVMDKKPRAGGWDEELYSRDMRSAIINDIKDRHNLKWYTSVDAYVYTAGKDLKPICLGIISIPDKNNPEIWEWKKKEELSNDDYNYLVQNPMESCIDEAKNDKGEEVPKVCPECGSKIGVFLKGEPVYLCTNKECNKFFGVVPFHKNESYINENSTDNLSYVEII